MKRTAVWDRRLWGVVMLTKQPVLIGELWWREMRDKFAAHSHDPTRPLLFTTRKSARAWVNEHRMGFLYRIKVVRVREMQDVIA